MTEEKVVSLAVLERNRKNARLSTGPRRRVGLKRASRNAVRHGLLTKGLWFDQTVPKKGYVRLMDRLWEELRPEGVVEEMLVERAAAAWWRLGQCGLALRAAQALGRRQSPEVQGDEEGRLAEAAIRVVGQQRWSSYQRRLRRMRRGLEEGNWSDARERDWLKEQIAGGLWQGSLTAQERAEVKEELARRVEEEGELAGGREEERHLVPEEKGRVELLLRYERTYERQLYRALNELERRQRVRAGEPAPAMVRVEVEG
jgi:hypothetical protein